MEKEKIIKIADYFIKKSESEIDKEPSKKLDALKLQKLLYYAKAWNLVLNKGDKLFPDEFQAWVHGPASPKVWHYFQEFNFSVKHPEIKEEEFSDIPANQKEVLDRIWDIYGKFDAKYLEMLTHSEDPWLKARTDLNDGDISQRIISDESIQSYYEQRFKEAAKS